MIIVTGTKRSGTSMWMQILNAAGFSVLGVPFPRDWRETLRDANREGFYESHLRHGIFYATNPDPASGLFLSPRETRQVAVKVFAKGVVKSDLAYVEKVIATMRPFREYVASLERLYAIERANRLAQGKVVQDWAAAATRAEASAVIWWDDNYSLLRDALIRGYPLHMISYASVLREPAHAVGEVLDWLGRGDREAAVAVVQQTLRTQHLDADSAPLASGLSRELEALFDELYRRVDQRAPLDASFIDQLNDAHDALLPSISAARAARRAQAPASGQADPSEARAASAE